MLQSKRTEAEQDQLEQIALANRILAHKGILDAFGHVSARSSEQPDRFLLARSMAPSLVRAHDVHMFDLDGRCTTDADVRPYLERFIHGEIYRRRPDVQSIVHAHSIAVIPFSIVAAHPMRAVHHVSAFIGEGLPVFEIRDFDEQSDLLIRNPDLGAALAEELGDASAILMRGHGFTVVGSSLRQAVYRAVYLESNARIQAIAEGLGDPVYLNAAEALAADAANNSQIDRPWELWARECPEVD